MVKQAKIAFLTWPTDSKVSSVIDWTVIWRVPSSFFENISSAIFLSENAFLRNIRKQAKKKGRRAWKIWLRRYRHSFARRAAKLPKTGLRWSQNPNYSNRKQWSTYKGRKIEWLALFFSKKTISNAGKKETKSDGELRQNTDFAHAATSRPAHMPSQLPARLSGIRSIHKLSWDTYRVELRAQANFSAPTFEPVHEACAGQRATLSDQSSAAVMQHLGQRSASELSP